MEQRLPDFAAWDKCVKAHVKPGEVDGIPLASVDYAGMRDDPNFTTFVKSLEGVDTSRLNKAEKYAVYINAYNALAIKTVIDHPSTKKLFGLRTTKIKSIKDAGTVTNAVWKRPAGVVGGRVLSLDDIENQELRNPVGFDADPRLHACIVCASVSCPDVATKAYMPETLEEDMSENLRAFLRNNKKGMSLDKAKGVLTLSKIFQWFAGDFTKTGHATVVEYLLPYFPPREQAWLAQHKRDVTLEYFNYNWNINQAQAGARKAPKCTWL
ncbi:unnamed protein product [Discosporangium mesarthrocarpum]